MSDYAPVLIANVPAVRLEYHDGDWYQVPEDTLSSEVEMGDFLCGLIRYLKPALVVETGCCNGYTTQAIGRALVGNLKGKVVSCDINPEKVAKAKELCNMGPYDIRLCSSLELPELSQADLIFSDSGDEIRIKEFERAKAGCTYVVHDTSMVSDFADFVRSNGGMVFQKGRGFGIIQKG